MVDHILKIPRLEVFGVKCFYCDTTQSYLQNNPTSDKDNVTILKRHLIPTYIGTPCIKTITL